MKIWHVIAVLALCLLCFMSGYHFRPHEPLPPGIDTVIVIDTITDSIPYPVYETVIQTVPELFPVYITLGGDTVRKPILVPMPITQKEYKTDDYRLSISGYKPNLDDIEIYRRTEYITRTISPNRWGIGAMVGYGIGKNGLSPYVGFGAYWRVW